MRNIFISAGHYDKDSGAIANHSILGNIKESDLNIEFRKLLQNELNKLDIDCWVDFDDDTLSTVIHKLNSLVNNNDILIDIHFNAATPKATGTEVFIKNDYTNFEYNISNDICDIISKRLKINNRGVKKESQSNRGRLGILHVPCETLLIEVCFISNENDINQYTKWKHILISEIADVIFKYIKE